MEPKAFTSEQDDVLIDLVRENPVLFDLSQKNYKDIVVKRNAWKKIASQLGKTEEECRTRWKTIRDTYRRNMNRLKEKTKTGSPAFMKSKYMNKILNFLETSMKKRSVLTNQPGVPGPSSSTCQVEAVNTCNQQEESTMNDSSHEENDAFSQYEDSVTLDLETGDDVDEGIDAENAAKCNKGKQKNVREKVLEEIKVGRAERSKLLNTLLNNQTPTPKTDPVDMFFQSMAEVVKQFPPNIITEARLKVCQVVSELELKALQQNNTENVITVASRNVTPNLTVHTVTSGDSANVLSPAYSAVASRNVTPNLTVHTVTSEDSENVLSPAYSANSNLSYIYSSDELDDNNVKTFVKL